MTRKKGRHVPKETIAIRAAVDIDEALQRLAIQWERSKSSTAEKVLRRGLDAISKDRDPDLAQLVDIWQRIHYQFRPLLIEQAKLMATWDLVNVQMGRDQTITTLVAHPTDAEIDEELRQLEEQLQAEPLSGAVGLGGAGMMDESMKQTIIRDRIAKRRQELLSQRKQPAG